MKTLKPSEVYLSPKKAIERMQNIFDKYGIERGLKSYSFQQSRESWIAAVYLIGLSYVEKKIFWLKSNPIKNDAPDIFAVSYRKPHLAGEIGIVREIYQLEVCEYDKHSKYGLPEHIIKKLNNKYYPKDTVLLCYIDHGLGYKFRLGNVISKLNKQKKIVSQIWLIYNTKDQKNTAYHISLVCPRTKPIVSFSVNYAFLFDKNFSVNVKDRITRALINQPEILTEKRGVNKDFKFEYIGKYIIPLPDDR